MVIRDELIQDSSLLALDKLYQSGITDSSESDLLAYLVGRNIISEYNLEHASIFSAAQYQPSEYVREAAIRLLPKVCDDTQLTAYLTTLQSTEFEPRLLWLIEKLFPL
jgi:hypothetical protein